MIPMTVHTPDPDALEALRIKLTTPPATPIFDAVFDAHADVLDPNFDRYELEELGAMERRTRPQEQK